MTVKRDAEIELITQFMKGDKETKTFLFDEVIGMTTSLLSQLKAVLVDGTQEEKKAVLKKIKFLRHIMQARYESIKAKANLSNEELNSVVEYLIAASPNFRSKISKAKQELEEQKKELSMFVLPNKKRSNAIKTKSKWIRS